MEKKTASTKSYNEKIKTPEYRMVNKKIKFNILLKKY